MLTIRGLATEVIKNIVLAGIGKLIIADNEDVKEEDLGTGFFFRDEDVGQKVRFVKFHSPFRRLLLPESLRITARGLTQPSRGSRVLTHSSLLRRFHRTMMSHWPSLSN